MGIAQGRYYIIAVTLPLLRATSDTYLTKGMVLAHALYNYFLSWLLSYGR